MSDIPITAPADVASDAEPAPTAHPAPASRLIKRHRWPVRLMHWINVVVLTIMLGSGLQIFNASPQLSWGQKTVPGQSLLAFSATQSPDGKLHARTHIGSWSFASTGWLGVSKVNGQQQPRGFPSWATIPGPQWLAMGRHWHFFFGWIFVINGLCYVAYSLLSRHFSGDLWPTRTDWRGFGRSVIDHVRLRHPAGENAARYNILQKLAYLIVLILFGGGIVLMGLVMSPRMDTVLKPVLELVGGRQSARTIHFVIAMLFVLFVLVHVIEVLLNRPLNELRGMITGWYRIRTARQGELPPAGAVPATANEESSHV